MSPRLARTRREATTSSCVAGGWWFAQVLSPPSIDHPTPPCLQESVREGAAAATSPRLRLAARASPPPAVATTRRFCPRRLPVPTASRARAAAPSDPPHRAPPVSPSGVVCAPFNAAKRGRRPAPAGFVIRRRQGTPGNDSAAPTALLPTTPSRWAGSRRKHAPPFLQTGWGAGWWSVGAARKGASADQAGRRSSRQPARGRRASVEAEGEERQRQRVGIGRASVSRLRASPLEWTTAAAVEVIWSRPWVHRWGRPRRAPRPESRRSAPPALSARAFPRRRHGARAAAALGATSVLRGGRRRRLFIEPPHLV